MLVASVGDSVQRGFNSFAGWVPHLLGAVVILLVGWIVARLIGALLSRGLQRTGFDRTLHRGHGGNWLERSVPRPSRLLGRVAYWIVFLGAVGLAAQALHIPALTRLVAAIYGYVPNVLAAVAIFVVAAVVSAAVAGLVSTTMGDTSMGKIVATAVPVVVMAIAGFMILEMLQISKEIVTITYAALLGSVALGMALAFGLGGREVAGRLLQTAYEQGREKKDELRNAPMARDGAESLART